VCRRGRSQSNITWTRGGWSCKVTSRSSTGRGDGERDFLALTDEELRVADSDIGEVVVIKGCMGHWGGDVGRCGPLTVT